MVEHIEIPRRFNGPPDSANGGYACGVVGTRIRGPAEVTLRSPPPLDRPLELSETEHGLALRDGDTLVAEATATTVELEPPVAVSLAEAEAAVAGYTGFVRHVFPTCFVCGPERGEGDGLRMFTGPVGGKPVVAAPWTPAEEFADRQGGTSPTIVWAALDCPTAFTGLLTSPGVLGRLAVDIRAPVQAGRPHVVMAWPLGSEGRKHRSAAAVTDPDGEVLAVSRATWIELRQAGGGSGSAT